MAHISEQLQASKARCEHVELSMGAIVAEREREIEGLREENLALKEKHRADEIQHLTDTQAMNATHADALQALKLTHEKEQELLRQTHAEAIKALREEVQKTQAGHDESLARQLDDMKREMEDIRRAKSGVAAAMRETEAQHLAAQRASAACAAEISRELSAGQEILGALRDSHVSLEQAMSEVSKTLNDERDASTVLKLELSDLKRDQDLAMVKIKREFDDERQRAMQEVESSRSLQEREQKRWEDALASCRLELSKACAKNAKLDHEIGALRSDKLALEDSLTSCRLQESASKEQMKQLEKSFEEVRSRHDEAVREREKERKDWQMRLVELEQTLALAQSDRDVAATSLSAATAAHALAAAAGEEALAAARQGFERRVGDMEAELVEARCERDRLAAAAADARRIADVQAAGLRDEIGAIRRESAAGRAGLEKTCSALDCEVGQLKRENEGLVEAIAELGQET